VSGLTISNCQWLANTVDLALFNEPNDISFTEDGKVAVFPG